MSRILNDVKRSLRVQQKAKAQEQDGLDGHMSQAIKAAVMPEVAAQVREALRDLPAQVRVEVQQTAAAQMDLLARKHARTQAEQRPAVAEHLREFTDQPLSSEFPPPAPMAKPVKDLTVSLQRNEVGRVKSVSIGKTTFTVQRDGEGRVVRMVQEDN